ncbi:MAG: radical SAM protein [Desulfobulbaceae bacterium]|nr:radical SAM protein [Desulfobulbaceae bacterium]
MKIKRVALITPPYHSGVVESAGTWLNLGFVYLAGALRQAGFEVDYYDAMSCWHDWPEIQKRIEDFRPDCVATAAFTASVVDALALLRLAKEINPQVITVIGNVHATFCYEDLVSKNTFLDYVIRGEGEGALPALLTCLKERGSLAKVPNLVYREGKIIHVNRQAPMLTELDRAVPAWDLPDWSMYSYFPKPQSTLAIVSSSRGCTQNCSFCSQKLFWQQTWRARSPENFVAELELLHRQHGVTVAMLADETPTLDRQRWLKILDLLIERQPGVKLLMETRVDDILRDHDIMEKYRLAGIEHIYVGVEAGTQAMLDIFHKGTKVESSKAAIDLINQADIVSETSFVLGMPDETPESIKNTVDLALHYNPDMAFFLAIAPWPYADLYPTLEPHIATDDYRRYNLVDPVVKPIAMTLSEVSEALGGAAQRFFMHKFHKLKTLSPWKQEFMTKVFSILVNNSYLAGQMMAMAQSGKGSMPPEILEIVRQGKTDVGKNFAPIP